MPNRGAMFLPLLAALFLSACSRRPSDETIANQIKARYFTDPAVKAAVLAVVVHDGRVTLAGSVSGDGVHLRAFQIAYAIPGVVAIDDHIIVTPPVIPPPPALKPIPVRASVPIVEPDGDPLLEPTAPPTPDPPAIQPPSNPALPQRALVVRYRPMPAQTTVVTTTRRPEPPPPADPPTVVETGAAAFALSNGVVPGVPTRAPRSSSRPVTIEAAGAALGFEVYDKWFELFNRQSRETIHAVPQGTGFAVKLLRERSLDLAFTDFPLSDSDEASLRPRPLHVPMLLDAVVLTYNLPGLTAPLNLTPQILAGIYLGRIVRWDDPAIAAANPQQSLPLANIVPVHRSDSCSATLTFNDYLSRVIPEWNALIGPVPVFARPAGLAGQADNGVAELIRETPYSLGYLDMSYAVSNRLVLARVLNATGDFVAPSAATVSAAAVSPYALAGDGRASIVNGEARMSYPISMYHWFVLPGTLDDPVKKRAIGGLIQRCLTTGQDLQRAGYTPIPQPVAADAIKRVLAWVAH